MSDITELAQDLSTDSLVTLFELDASQFTNGGVYRFTSSTYEPGKVVWNGAIFDPIDIEAEGFEWSGQGALPTPKVRVSNVNNVFSGLVFQTDGLVGAKLTRVRTFRTFLDDGPTPDPNAILNKDIYRVERMLTRNKMQVEWELAAVIDQEGQQLPGRMAVRDYCSHTYRRWDPETGAFDYTGVTCPYVGQANQGDGRYFDENGNEVSDPSQDRCSKLIGTGCRRRFAHTSGEPAQGYAHGVLPFRGFPGLSRIGG